MSETSSRENAEQLVSQLEEGAEELANLDDEELLAGWSRTLEALEEHFAVPENGPFRDELVEQFQLSPAGLGRGLEVFIEGSSIEVARRLLARKAPRSTGYVAVLLSSTPPGLALQVLLPALVKRRPVLIKASSSDTVLTDLIVDSLHTALPETERSIVVLHWRGGDPEIEEVVLGGADRIVAYGRRDTLEPLEEQYGERVVAHGPKLSAALLSRDCSLAEVVPGLAQDIALFDQRGCLSLQWIFTEHDLETAVGAVGESLERLMPELPMGPLDDRTAGRIQAARASAIMHGAVTYPETPTRTLARGTVLGRSLPVIADLRTSLEPSPGGRTVWLFQVAEIGRAAQQLAHCADLLQGVVLEGKRARAQHELLERAGVAHLAAAGSLQRVDAGWKNGGYDPLDVY